MTANRRARTSEPTTEVASASADDLDRLRALLLADDRIQLDARTSALEEALAQAVTNDAFAERLTAELAKALKRAERNDPKAIARAISPAVVQSIRREIVNSREDMVEALYPITGRMVRAAVRDSFSNLIADLNKRLDALTSPTLLKAHAKSIIFRKPASSFLIAESRDGLSLERGLLIDRQSGNLVHAWQSDVSSERSDESNLVSSMFAAISTFTAENYDGPDAELRTLDLNGRQVALRHSARHMLVVEHTGTMHGQAANHMDACFETIVENTDDPDALAAVDLLGVPLAESQTVARSSNIAKYVFAALGFVILALLVWHVWDRVWFAGKADLVAHAIAEQAPFHAPAVEVARLDRTITVRGLVPPDFTLSSLSDQLAQAGVTLNNRTQPVAGVADLANARNEAAEQLATLNNELAALTSTIRQQDQSLVSRLDAGLADINAQLQTQRSDLETEQTALADRIDRVASDIVTMRSQLSQQVNAIDQQSDMLTQQRSALSALEEKTVAANEQTAAFASQMSGDLAQQQAALAESKNSLASLQQQLAALSATQASNAGGFVEAMRIRFRDESAPEDASLVSAQIRQLAGLAQAHGFQLLVQGYSDQTGSDDINDRISLARANYVRDQLVEAGLAPDTVSAQGLGAVADANGVVARQVRVRVVEEDR